MLPHSAPRMLPPRPLDQHQVQGPPMPPPVITPSSGGRRKLPNIPRSAKLPHRPHVPHEPHYPSSFHSSFDEDMAPSMGSNLPPTVYESYHQQYRQLQRQQSSPIGSNRQLPMAPFGHRRTASSSSFTQPDEMGKPEFLLVCGLCVVLVLLFHYSHFCKYIFRSPRFLTSKSGPTLQLP